MAGPVGSGREAHRSEARTGDRLTTTVRCAVEYDGTAFCGFQFQPELRSVAGTLEKALSRLFDEPVKITGAGRTDAGVHASGQVISFTTARSFPFEKLAIALNSALPEDISVRDAAVVLAPFSARFSAVERRYVYAILHQTDRSALLAHRAYHVYRPMDIDAMRLAARYLLGEHDFRSFCGVLPESGGTVRTLKSLEIHERAPFVRVDISADGFLHRMVRTIVGTLVECGRGGRDPHSMPAVLSALRREAAGVTAPARGLYLAGVKYGDGYDSFREPPLFAGEESSSESSRSS